MRTAPIRAFPTLPEPNLSRVYPTPNRPEPTPPDTKRSTSPYPTLAPTSTREFVLGVKVERDEGNRPPWPACSSLPDQTPTMVLYPTVPYPTLPWSWCWRQGRAASLLRQHVLPYLPPAPPYPNLPYPTLHYLTLSPPDPCAHLDEGVGSWRRGRSATGLTTLFATVLIPFRMRPHPAVPTAPYPYPVLTLPNPTLVLTSTRELVLASR